MPHYPFQPQYLHHLQQGRVLLYPTETLWGLGVDAFHPKAVEALFQLKQRDKKKSISLLVRDIKMAQRLVHVSPLTEKLIQILSPGPFTFVLPMKEKSLKILSPSNDFIGIRISSHPFVTKLVWSYKNPITTTSANISGMTHFSSKDFKIHPHILWVKTKNELSPQVSNPNPTKNPNREHLTSNQASTVIQIKNCSFKILRQGSFDLSLLHHWMKSLGFEKTSLIE